MMKTPSKPKKNSRSKSTLKEFHRPQQIDSVSFPLLLRAAERAQKNSYSPYSQCKVGAAILTDKGEIFSGCNVENSSYGGTVCAERVAIWNAISQSKMSKKKLLIKEVCVVSPSSEIWPPCGFCRQVIAEFSDQTTRIYLVNSLHHIESLNFSIDLFPKGFDGQFLKQPPK